MRIASVLAVTTLVFGGFAACEDHNPKVVFSTDAAVDGKTEAGAAQDTGAGSDAVAVPDAPMVLDVGAVEADATVAAEAAPEANRGIDGLGGLDANVKSEVATSVDGAGSAVDGSGSAAIEVGVDSSSTMDGGKAGG